MITSQGIRTWKRFFMINFVILKMKKLLIYFTIVFLFQFFFSILNENQNEAKIPLKKNFVFLTQRKLD